MHKEVWRGDMAEVAGSDQTHLGRQWQEDTRQEKRLQVSRIAGDFSPLQSGRGYLINWARGTLSRGY